MRLPLPVILIGLGCLVSITTAQGQALIETATPESVGMSTARLARVSDDLTAGGFAVALDPAVYGHAISPGEYWWDGSAGTRFWINPRENMIAVIMAQVSPASGNGFREAFRDGIQAAIIESRAP